MREAGMNYIPKIDRRSFVVSAAAAGGGPVVAPMVVLTAR